VSAQGALEQIDDLNKRIAALSEESARAELGKLGAASFIRWFLAARPRPISPLSAMTVEDYIKQMLAMGWGRAEAERAFPGHPGLREAPSGPARGAEVRSDR